MRSLGAGLMREGIDMRRKSKLAAFSLYTVLCIVSAASPVNSQDKPSQYLKNVLLVVYPPHVLEPPNRGPCAIDLEAWDTAIEFVANQSIKLKLIKEREHREQAKQLSDKVAEAGRHFSDTAADTAQKALDEADENLRKYLYAPKLWLSAQAIEHNGGCFGTLEGSVKAALKPSEMISTGTIVYRPYVEMWSDARLLLSASAEFSRFVIQSSEGMMKKFVNDWALSQE